MSTTKRLGAVYGGPKSSARALPGLPQEYAPPGVGVKVGVCALVVFLWAWAWAPQLLDLLNIGRQSLDFGETARRSAPAAEAYKLIIGCIGALSIILIINGLASARRNHIAPVLYLLAPWAALSGAYVLQGGRNSEILLYPVVATAFALNWALLHSVYSTLRWLIVVTAAASVALGVLQPSIYLSAPDQIVSNDKALIGNQLLNGLFPTSNQLGLTLALGIPLLVVTGRGGIRWLSLGLVLIAMVWASSRTSLIVSVVVMLVLISAGRGRRPSVAVGRSVALVAACLVIAVPFIFTDPSSFTNRGRIWQISLHFTFDEATSLVLGNGIMVFRELSPVTYAIGAPALTGHNVFVTVITVGGLVAVATVVLLWCTYLIRAGRTFEAEPLPMFFLLMLTALSVIEDPLRAFIICPQAFIIIPLLAMPLAAAYESRGNALSSDLPSPEPRLSGTDK